MFLIYGEPLELTCSQGNFILTRQATKSNRAFLSLDIRITQEKSSLKVEEERSTKSSCNMKANLRLFSQP